jgi:septal ring factor EnvC (AmiA/AmiB activator)
MQQKSRRGIARVLLGALGAAAVAAGLAACAPNSETVATTLMSDPLKYEFYDCKQLENQMKGLSVQEQKLRDLIAKAEQEAAGVLVATIAYKNDYAKLRADMRIVRDTQQRKNCIKETGREGLGAVH